MAGQVIVGLFDGYMSTKRDALTSETKIGGTPTYFPRLDPAQAARLSDWTTCGVCGHKMFLLAQAFSPLPGVAPPHHRMMYVFCCNSASCALQPSSSWCAFSVQVDAEDAPALEEEEEGEGEEEEVIQMSALLPSELPAHTFPPCYVYVEDEPQNEVVVPTDLEQELIRMAETNAQCGGDAISEAELAELEAAVDLKGKRADYLYEKFRSRVARAPTQVLRYHSRCAETPGVPLETHRTKREGLPLFMNPEKVRRLTSIPCCSECGAALVYELQVMPTAVYYLKVGLYTTPGRSTGDEGVDFGTATVYVCSRWCSARAAGVVLRREVVCVEAPPTLRDDEDDLHPEGKDDAAKGKGPAGPLNLRAFMAGLGEA